MDENLPKDIVFSKNVVEFVTVGVQYCSFLESFSDTTSLEMADKLTKLLPLLYLKASLLPEINIEYDIYTEVSVTEDDYNYVMSRLFNIFKGDDSYLEVFLDDMKYSDTPISASISEDIADIYQDIKNFVSIYELGVEENMLETLFNCTENFKGYWGQKLVNVMRALHSIKYNGIIETDQDNLDTLNDDSEW